LVSAVTEHGMGYFSSQPRAALSHRVGSERHFETVGIPLTRLKRIKEREQSTLNDIALSLVAAGIASVLCLRSAPGRDAVVKSAVPVSRRRGEAATYGNQVS